MDKIFKLHSYYFPIEITNKILYEQKGLCHPIAKIIRDEVNVFKQNIMKIKMFTSLNINRFFDGSVNISYYIYNLKKKKSRGRTGDIMKNEIKNMMDRVYCHKVPEGGVERVFMYSEYDEEHRYRWIWGDLQSMVMNY